MAVGVDGSYGVEPESRQPGKWQRSFLIWQLTWYGMAGYVMDRTDT